MALVNHLLALPTRLSGWRFGGSGGLGGQYEYETGQEQALAPRGLGALPRYLDYKYVSSAYAY